jgi:hypothetical protein
VATAYRHRAAIAAWLKPGATAKAAASFTKKHPAPAAGGGGNQGVVNAIGGGIVSGLAGLVDGIVNSPADLVAMQAHTPPAYHVNLSGAWDNLWESRTGIQPGSPNDWLLHETSTATGIATLLIPGIDAVSGTVDTLRGVSETRALADGLTTTAPEGGALQQEAQAIRESLNVGARRNVSVAQYKIDGVTGQLRAVSGQAARPGTVGVPENPMFNPTAGPVPAIRCGVQDP